MAAKVGFRITRCVWLDVTCNATAGVESTHAHGLGATPDFVLITSSSAGYIYLSSTATDATNIYLKSSLNSATGIVLAGFFESD